MERLERVALLSRLIDELKSEGSWTGETHVQKACLLLKDVGSVPLGYDFVLYQHGPFSFELRDELAAMRADGLVELRPRPFPYGPSLDTTQNAKALQERFRDLIDTYLSEIQEVAKKVGQKSASQLERLSTAFWVSRHEPDSTPDEWAQRVHELKPHVSIESARQAIDELAVFE